MGYEAVSFDNIAATTLPFTLTLGGTYVVSVKGTFGGSGLVSLQALARDKTTYLNIKAAFDNAGALVDQVIGSFAADGVKSLVLSPGQYRFTVADTTALYASIARAPLA